MLPKGVILEYKFIKKNKIGEVVWEQSSNRFLFINKPITVNKIWGIK